MSKVAYDDLARRRLSPDALDYYCVIVTILLLATFSPLRR
jgi:hypothetical protein